MFRYCGVCSGACCGDGFAVFGSGERRKPVLEDAVKGHLTEALRVSGRFEVHVQLIVATEGGM